MVLLVLLGPVERGGALEVGLAEPGGRSEVSSVGMAYLRKWSSLHTNGPD